jgi:hypothetical protein
MVLTFGVEAESAWAEMERTDFDGTAKVADYEGLFLKVYDELAELKWWCGRSTYRVEVT